MIGKCLTCGLVQKIESAFDPDQSVCSCCGVLRTMEKLTDKQIRRWLDHKATIAGNCTLDAERYQPAGG